MTTKRFGRVFLVAAALGSLPLRVFADEIVHFTNGAEMTVRSHTVEKDKETVKLDLGGNSFIAFPMSMVDKIENAGRDVFLNPVFHPANQAIAGGSGGAVADNSIRGTADSGGLAHRAVGKGDVGAALGEVAEAPPIASVSGLPVEQSIVNSRRVFNPAFTSAPGSLPQVINRPGKPRTPVQFAMVPTRTTEQPAAPSPTFKNDMQDNAPEGDPAPEDPPDTP
jgi:hypothetical protein